MNWFCALARELDVGNWIAVVGSAAAWFAAWQAYRSAQASRASQLLAQEALARGEPSIAVYLADARLIHASNRTQRVYVLQLLISNQSIAANSIKRISLSMEHGSPGRPRSHLAVDHSHEVPVATGASDADALKLPVSIGAGESLRAVAQFLVNEELLQGDAVESCSVLVTDSHDRNAKREVIFTRECDQ